MKIHPKRTSIIMILLSLIIFTLSACKNDYSTPPESDLNTSDTSNAVYIVTEKTKYTTKDTFIRYQIINHSDTVFSKSKEDFVLQKYGKNNWENYPFKKDRVYTYEDYTFTLSKGESTNESITIKSNFDIPLDKGYYRIIHFGLTSNVFISE